MQNDAVKKLIAAKTSECFSFCLFFRFFVFCYCFVKSPCIIDFVSGVSRVQGFPYLVSFLNSDSRLYSSHTHFYARTLVVLDF